IFRASSGKRAPTYSDLASISALSLRMAVISSTCAATRWVSGLATSRRPVVGLATVSLGAERLATLGAITALETCVLPHLAQASCRFLACFSYAAPLANHASNWWPFLHLRR